MSYNGIDPLELISHIRHRLNQLESEIVEDRIKSGECPHKNTSDASTFQNIREGFKVVFCRDCGKFFKYEIPR